MWTPRTLSLAISPPLNRSWLTSPLGNTPPPQARPRSLFSSSRRIRTASPCPPRSSSRGIVLLSPPTNAWSFSGRECLKALKDSAHLPILIRSDNQTLTGGLSSWLAAWKANGWRKRDKKAPESLDLWQEIDALCEPLSVQAERVKAESDDPWLDRCNAARDAALRMAVSEWQAGK
ncbi:RNase H family protein [Paracoccus sp. 22332]|uniref:RNase H family protein n=1 Tax=Paracoccus sp. 22332 TaxID=3453913 RepID=UPI003F84DDDB